MTLLSRSVSTSQSVAKNVILFIGDGMGQAHRFAGQLLSAGRDGKLAMDRLAVHGQMGTMSADPQSFVTDSAAAATAIATGVKTVNGAVSIDPEGRERLTILELARSSGRAVGLVTTCQLTDATPAAFASHVPHRIDQSEIARQYIERSQVDVLLGGGAAHWYPTGYRLPASLTSDGTARGIGTKGNLVERAEELGYEFVSDADGLEKVLPAVVVARAGRSWDSFPLKNSSSRQRKGLALRTIHPCPWRISLLPRLPCCLNRPKVFSSWSKSRPSIACATATTRL